MTCLSGNSWTNENQQQYCLLSLVILRETMRKNHWATRVPAKDGQCKNLYHLWAFHRTVVDGKICLVYFKDISWVKLWGTLVELKGCFCRLMNDHLQLNANKCVLFQKNICPKPSNKYELKIFLRLNSYYRCFVMEYSKIAKTLHPLVGKNMTLDFPNCQ